MAALSTAIEQTALLGDTTAKPPKQNIILRNAHLSDLRIMAVQAKEAYWGRPATNFIAPKASEYPEDLVRAMLQGLQNRFVKPNTLTIVACVPGQNGGKEKIVGFGQFLRRGDGEVAKRFVRSKGRIHLLGLWLLAWWFWAWHFLSNKIWPDRASDKESLKILEESAKMDYQRYWLSHPERSESWHAAAVVVNPKYQGQGIGRLLMGHVIEKAQQERVLMGLTASTPGEFLYRKLGFEMLGDYSRRIGDEAGGGIMIRYPEGWEGKRHDDV